MKAYLERWDNEWLDDFVYQSTFALKELNVEIVPFDGEKIEELITSTKFDRTDILIGSVEATSIFFKAMNIEEPKYIGYPDSIKKFLHRNIRETKLTNCNEWEYPYFVKPIGKVKLFTGSVVENRNQFDILNKYMNIPIDSDIYQSEFINIVSEYRCFIHKNKLVGIEWYLGDFTKFINIPIINEIIDSYASESPIAYTLDIGIKDSGESVLVEINDFWAIGSYGFDSKKYLRMLIDRMNQIKGLI